MSREKENKTNIEQSQPIDKSRRKLTMTGLAVPVILSISSRPVWAAPANCSFIQALSGNISVNGPNPSCSPTLGSSVSPGWYKTHQGEWSTYCGSPLTYSPGDKFNAIFGADVVIALVASAKDIVPGTTSGLNITNSDPTLGECFDSQNDMYLADGTDLKAKCFHYMAALLSASSSILIFPYTAQAILEDWGTFALYPKLQKIQKGEYTVGQVGPLLI